MTKIATGLIADIGGTNARFALIASAHIRAELHESDLLHQRVFATADYPNPVSAILSYLSDIPEQYQRPDKAVLALACPVDSSEIRMTNNHWVFYAESLAGQIEIPDIVFINDFTAQACALAVLAADDLYQVGGGQPDAGQPAIVTGPGTGLGLAAVVPLNSDSYRVISGEGGHIDFAPVTPRQQLVRDNLLPIFNRVSAERLLSGQGIEHIYQALYEAEYGTAHPGIGAARISEQGLKGNDPLSIETLNLFCEVLGSYAGDMALIFGAKGGVYIGGGIIPRMTQFLQQSQFRTCFESKGRMKRLLKDIPVYIITASQPGLLGAAARLLFQGKIR